MCLSLSGWWGQALLKLGEYWGRTLQTAANELNIMETLSFALCCDRVCLLSHVTCCRKTMVKYGKYDWEDFQCFDLIFNWFQQCDFRTRLFLEWDFDGHKNKRDWITLKVNKREHVVFLYIILPIMLSDAHNDNPSLSVSKASTLVGVNWLWEIAIDTQEQCSPGWKIQIGVYGVRHVSSVAFNVQTKHEL